VSVCVYFYTRLWDDDVRVIITKENLPVTYCRPGFDPGGPWCERQSNEGRGDDILIEQTPRPDTHGSVHFIEHTEPVTRHIYIYTHRTYIIGARWWEGRGKNRINKTRAVRSLHAYRRCVSTDNRRVRDINNNNNNNNIGHESRYGPRPARLCKQRRIIIYISSWKPGARDLVCERVNWLAATTMTNVYAAPLKYLWRSERYFSENKNHPATDSFDAQIPAGSSVCFRRGENAQARSEWRRRWDFRKMPIPLGV